MSVCRWEPGDLDPFEVKDLDEVVKQVERSIPHESPLFKYFVVDAVLSSQFQIPLESILRVWDVHVLDLEQLGFGLLQSIQCITNVFE